MMSAQPNQPHHRGARHGRRRRILRRIDGGIRSVDVAIPRVPASASSRARRDRSPHGWLLTGLAASIASFGVGMFTYDAFSFEQVIFVFFIFLGMAAAAMRPEPIS